MAAPKKSTKRVRQPSRKPKMGSMTFRRHDADEERWRDAADSLNVDFADWVRETLTAAANKVLGDHGT